MEQIESRHFEQLWQKMTLGPVRCGHCEMIIGDGKYLVVGGVASVETCSLLCATRLSPVVQRVFKCPTNIKKV